MSVASVCFRIHICIWKLCSIMLFIILVCDGGHFLFPIRHCRCSFTPGPTTKTCVYSSSVLSPYVIATRGSAWPSVLTDMFFVQGLLLAATVAFLTLEVDGTVTEPASYSSQIKSGPLPAFVNKVLLKHSPAHSLMYCLWLIIENIC